MRVALASIGALAGLSIWLLIDVLPDAIDNKWLFLWLGSVICGFFTLLLGLIGPLKPREAFSVAGVLGITAAALFYWSSLRFTEIDDFFEIGFDPAAFAILIFVGAPFGAAVMRGRVMDYAYLFDTAWGIVVRYLAAWVFVGLFWGALFLSHALLEIVGISLIWDLVEVDAVPYLLTGLVLGLALAVANELRAYVSPYLLLRLLRLLMPPLVLVVGVFILALPFRGLSGLFGEFSAAGTLMAVAIVGASLIAAAVDSTDEEAINSRLMQLATRAFAAMLPILGILAVWAIVIRVSDYGWTPERLAAFVASMFVLGYGLLYGWALLRGDWMAQIRRANIYKALAILLVAALWLTPLLDASRISANTQVSRYINGVSDLENLPVWEIANAWGRAGQKALARLEEMESDAAPGLAELVERAKTESRWEFRRDNERKSTAEIARDVLSVATVLPSDQVLSADELASISRYHLENLDKHCRASGCVLLLAKSVYGERETMLSVVPQEQGNIEVLAYRRSNGSLSFTDRFGDLSEAEFEALKAGQFRVAPSSLNSIWIGEREVGGGEFGGAESASD